MFKNKPSRRTGFTLVEIMLVVAILSLLATLAIPNYLRSRKRSQAVRILDDLKALDGAIDLFAAEYHRKGNEVITEADVDLLKRYVKDRTVLHQSLPLDMFGNEFVFTDLATPPRLSQVTFDALADVAPAAFWAPYAPVEE